MNSYEDRSLLNRFQAVQKLIEGNKLVISAQTPGSGGLPGYVNEKVGIVNRYDSAYGRYVLQTSWGIFQYDRENQVYILMQQTGEIPEALQTPVKSFSASATLWPDKTTIQLDHTDRVVELDLVIDRSVYIKYEILNQINRTLYESGIPILVWRVDFSNAWATQPVNRAAGGYRIANESVSVVVSSAVIDTDHRQMVAVQLMPESKQSAQAIRASLSTNSAKAGVSLSGGEHQPEYLSSARQGCLTLAATMQEVGAAGNVVVYMHQLCADPSQAKSTDYFYIIETRYQPDKIRKEFITRLNVSITWPLLEAWGEYLLNEGRRYELVKDLDLWGDEFTRAILVERAPDRWEAIIRRGLQEGEITL
ncbi:MAG: hypothetical protein ACKOC5_02430 [Chloroflexota bacterium]